MNFPKAKYLLKLSLLVAALVANQPAMAGMKPIKEIWEPVGNFSPDKFVKVAAIAFSPAQDAPVDVPQSTINKYKKSVADDIEQLVREAAKNGAKLVVTPEFSLVGYPHFPGRRPEDDEFENVEQILPYAEAIGGAWTTRFGALAKELKINLIIGIAEKGAGAKEVYNTLVVLEPTGKIATTYRKINLFAGETNFLKPGKTRVFWESPWGRIGLFTCYDIHFPNPAGDLVTKDKVRAIAFSTSWVGDDGMSSFKAYAAQNNVYFIAANHTYFPDSGVVSPGGVVQSHIRQSSGAVYGYLPLK